MPEKRISRVTIKRITGSSQIEIRAEAGIALPGVAAEVSSSGVRIPRGADDAHVKASEDEQLSELRKRLYAAGYSKRAIAAAVRNVVRVESRELSKEDEC